MEFYKSKYGISGLIVFAFLFLSSCFEIIEEVNLNSDGSGSFCFTINMSQSKLQLNSMFLLDTVNGRPMPKREDLAKAFDKIEAALKEDKGLSAVVTKRNWDDYIFSVSGNFSNIDALNKAINRINTIFNQTGSKNDYTQDNYMFSDKLFSRLYNYNLVNEYNSLSEKDKSIFENAKYTTIYRFGSTVATFSNPDARVSKSGKAVMLKVNVKDLITNAKTIKNSINLK